ncbi:aminopeptidase N [Microlunatus elymi]|uniref:Aminopeptidase N n=1 Tax=Microlunatus elymi TaxID=2596828 RepID=A0A516PXH6_9ACTN|nr:aminopeptidase N [Microlunatus elymi]QDP95877.1 aminopeptidase N [Microlunatus elymi]
MFLHNLTRDEAGRRSGLLDTRSYNVTIDLTGGDLAGNRLEQPETTFVSRSVVDFAAVEEADTHVDLIAERVLSASLNGVDLDPATFDGSRLPLRVAEGDNELVVTALCRYSRSGEGLHRFVDPADGRIYLYTQFEASEARRVYACFEQPDLKATFELTVLAPSSWTVIANSIGDEREPVEGQEVNSWWHFPPTPRVSTYLTSLIAGEYAVVTDSHRAKSGELPMSILVRQSLREYLDADRIFATTKAGFDIFEQHFGYAYPFGKYDQSFVPEYNMGAMENIGCVTLRDELVFRSRVTEASYRTRDDTILHELAHMWFGDLVTMVWWDDMWLKESFAEFAATFAIAERSGDPETAWATFTGSRKNWAYRQDQLPTTHPIAADMVDLEAVESNFDGITYAKGASVLRQLVAFVGQDAFLEGVRGYFAEHAFGNTRLADLLAALEGPSGRDLSGWSAEWLQTAGVNTLWPVFETDDSGVFTRFAVEQTAIEKYPTLRHHRIAIGFYNLIDGTLQRTHRVEVDVADARTEIAELVGAEQPDLVLLNDDDLSYAKIRFDQRSLQTLIENLSALPSPLARAVCWGAAWDLCRDAELPAADYAELVLHNVSTESDLSTVRAVLANAGAAVRSYTPPTARDKISSRWEDGLAELVNDAEAGSDHQLALARAYAAAVNSTTGAARLGGWLQGAAVPKGLEIDTELRWLLIKQLARLGRVDDELIMAESERDNTASGQEQAAAARAARPTAEAKATAWALAVDGNDIPNETQRQICLAFWQPGQADVLSDYLDKYLNAAEQISTSAGIWAQKSSIFRQNVLTYLFPDIADDAAFIGRVRGWLAAGVTANGGPLGDMVKHLVAEELDAVERAHRCQQAAR